MSVWLKPDVMSSHGLVPSDVINALNEQSLEAAPGRLVKAMVNLSNMFSNTKVNLVSPLNLRI